MCFWWRYHIWKLALASQNSKQPKYLLTHCNRLIPTFFHKPYAGKGEAKDAHHIESWLYEQTLKLDSSFSSGQKATQVSGCICIDLGILPPLPWYSHYNWQDHMEASTEEVGVRQPVSESALRVSIFKISAVVLIILNNTAGGLGIRWQTVCWHRGTISCLPLFSLGLQIGHQPPTHACGTSYPSSGRHHPFIRIKSAFI